MENQSGGSDGEKKRFLPVLVFLGFIAIGAVVVTWVTTRGEPAVVGPPPTLPEYSPPTSLSPRTDVDQSDTTSPEANVVTNTDTAAPQSSTTTAPPAPVVTVRADGTGDFMLLQAAIDQAQPGDVIEVSGGEWGEQVIQSVGSPDAWLRITAAPGERPIIRGVNDGRSGFELDGASFVEISGFEIIGPSNTSSGAGVRIINSSHHIRVEDNVIHDFPGNGVEVIESGTVAVVDNEIFGNSRRSKFQTSGVSFFKPFGDDDEGFENVISGNTVYDNENTVPNDREEITDGNCLIMDNTRWPNGEYEYPGETLIENNVCFDNGGRGIHVLKADNVYVVNNTLFNNLRTDSIEGGELSADDARNVLFRNNLVWPREEEDALLVGRSESVGFDNNVYVLPSGGQGDFEETAVVVRDPELVNPTTDPSAADFSPEGGSVLLGTGSVEESPLLDQAATERPPIPTPGALEVRPR